MGIELVFSIKPQARRELLIIDYKLLIPDEFDKNDVPILLKQ